MKNITLISGSTTGNAEYVAEHLASKLKGAGLSTNTLHGPILNELPLQGIWLVISSTHYAGKLPKNLQPLYEELEQRSPNLSFLRFGAIGLGNREYGTFCGAIRKFEQLLITLGAKRIGDRLEIDALEHEIPEYPAEIWIKRWRFLL